MILASEVTNLLIDAGWCEKSHIKKVIQFWHIQSRQNLYVNKESKTGRTSIYLDPSRWDENHEDLCSMNGVSSSAKFSHNDDLKEFPKKLKNGIRASHYGIPFGFDSVEDCSAFLNELTSEYPFQHLDSLKDIINEPMWLGTPGETEREAKTKARIGQSKWRAYLIRDWGGCSVTGLEDVRFLTASHIKPWRSSSSDERLNPNNGLLLTPNLDQLFDQGLITFDKRGGLKISRQLSKESQKVLGLRDDQRLRKSNSSLQEFLEVHRTEIFKS